MKCRWSFPLLVFFLLLVHVGPAHSVYIIETVEDSVYTWRETCVALDGDENPHIGYETDHEVRYAYKQGGSWLIDSVASIPIDGDISLYLSAEGDAYLYYIHGHPLPGYVMEAVRDHETGVWETNQVGVGVAYSPASVSAAMGSDGVRHVVYTTEDREFLMHCWYDEGIGQWQTEVVTEGVLGSPSQPSLVVDSTNRPRIAFFSLPTASSAMVCYATKPESEWIIDVLTSTFLAPDYRVSLELDASDNPHLVFPLEWDYKFIYMADLGSGWESSELEPGGGSVRDPSFGLSAAGFPRIAYQEWSPSPWGVRYALRDSTEGPWSVTWADSGVYLGKYTGLALTEDDRPYISYVDDLNYLLKLAHWEDIEAWHVPGDAPTIAAALDSAGMLDTIIVASGVYHENSLQMKSGIVLRSETPERGSVVIDADSLGRCLECVDCDSTTFVIGLTFTGGNSLGGGGVSCSNSEVTFDRCTFKRNFAMTGGGLRVVNGDPHILRCVFEGNTADLTGGGISLGSSAAVIESCLVFENRAPRNGCAVNLSSSFPQILSCTIAHNVATDGANGRVFSLVSSSVATLVRTIVYGNTGAFTAYCDGSSSAALYCCDVYGNSGGDYVGCFSDQGGMHDNFSADPLFCGAASGDYTLHSDSPCSPEHAPVTCGLIGATGVGCGPSTGVEETVPVVPATAFMKPARPNPFNPTTTIAFGVPRPGPVRIVVHDLAGRVVSVLIDEEMAPGEFSTEWNGRDGANRPAPSGIYFARMRAGGFSETRRLVLMR